MLNFRHLLRMKKWAHNPPSEKRVKLFLGVLAVCLALFAIEWLFGWPEALTLDNTPKGRITR